MEALVAVAAAGLLLLAAVRYLRAYREAREWREVHAAWGAQEREQAQAICEELRQSGIRVKLKTIGMSDITRMLPQQFTSIRVHESDYARAAEVVRSLTGR